MLEECVQQQLWKPQDSNVLVECEAQVLVNMPCKGPTRIELGTVFGFAF